MKKMTNKSLIILSLFLGTFLYASDSKAIKKLEEASQRYNKNVQILKGKNSVDNFEESEEIKSKLSIISGRAAAGLNIATEFNYYRTSVYEIYTKPNHTTSLKFSKDENIIYVGGGDKENWEVEETKGGGDDSTFLFIKPLLSDLETNFNVITDKRTYFISLKSTDSNYNPFVQWKYPYDATGMKFNVGQSKGEIKLNGNIDKLNFGYSYNKNKSFSPIQVFNDGEKTILIMPENLQEAPSIYGYGEDKQLSLINYRYVNNRIIIDKVVNRLQLILGKEKLDIKK
ncbi:conjugal transfer protein TrbG [Leptotrichia sp. OH3620_COT-345]|uniref:TrbG/VirB9 family P-type conjugative transfer protein n=1 Tax=Leptotrichia sp. OH3620_COT-345 TaxID=2491048 RepID=UPI000F6466D9|nr:TrbG/VirB9 family P-type conjugative transfer protein [Leptotrichia sp. OH3620_COT-345]RRD40372.1 conjugal transfer protein TrbG [Leptotrichia sp. OH3620_COT-345]